MSTWTSSVAAALCLLGLGGCAAGESADAPGPHARAVAAGATRVTLAAPAGFCMDRRASRPAADPPMLLFLPCGEDAPVRPALLTATAAPGDPTDTVVGSGPALERYLRSAPGRAGLSRSGQAESVTVLGTVMRGGALVVHLRDTSPPPAPGLSATYRRAFLDAGGALVSVAVLGIADDPLGNVESRVLLDRFVAATKAANAAPARAGPG
jgi:hypothetical protein